jgi:hypothetical protein
VEDALVDVDEDGAVVIGIVLPQLGSSAGNLKEWSSCRYNQTFFLPFPSQMLISFCLFIVRDVVEL